MQVRKVIDGHTHGYAQEVIDNPSSWADARGEFYWKSLVVDHSGHRSLQGWANEDGFLADMEIAGVAHSVLQSWYWEHQATCAWQHGVYYAWAKGHPNEFSWFAGVQPRDGLVALDDLKNAVETLGAKGVGEVFPGAQGFDIKNKVWLKIVEYAIENKLPINMHVTEPVGRGYVGRIEEPLSDYVWLAKEYPELRLILAHWGGGLFFYELNPYIKKILKNVYYDTAASPLIYDIDIFKCALSIVGAEKIIFGSDYPLRLFPKDEGINIASFMGQIDGLGVGEDELSCIYGSNILNLLS